MNINIITIVIMAVVGLAALAMGCYMAYCAGWRDGRASGYKEGYTKGSEFDRVMGYNEGLNDGIRQGRETCAVTNGKIDGCEHYGQHGRCKLMSDTDNPRLCADECRGIGRRAVTAVAMALFAAFSAVTQAATADWTISWTAAIGYTEHGCCGSETFVTVSEWSASSPLNSDEYHIVAMFDDGWKFLRTRISAQKLADSAIYGTVITAADFVDGAAYRTDTWTDGTQTCEMRVRYTLESNKPGPGGGIEPGAIPEPTSGLLLLVGVGLLMMKRKEVAE